MNYKELSAEWPNKGQLCQVFRPDDSKQGYATSPIAFYANFGFEDGIPVWKGISPMRKPANPKDTWILASILSTDVIQPETPAEPIRAYFDSTLMEVNERLKYVWDRSGLPTNRTQGNFVYADGEVKFVPSEEGKWWMEGFDKIRAYAKDHSVSPEQPSECNTQGESPAPSNMPWKSWSQELETRDLRIKELEGYLNAQGDRIVNLENNIKQKQRLIDSIYKMIGDKDKCINDLLLEKQQLTARLNQPE